METIIGAYDPESRTVTVTFTQGDIVHERKVNACHDQAGEYDEAATEERVAAVGRGVAVKISLGVIRMAEPEVTIEPVDPAEEPAA